MKRPATLLALVIAIVVFTTTHSGHEMPVYPSYYPQEIRIESVAPQSAARLLQDAKIHAYVADKRIFETAIAKSISYVDSLGAYLVLTLNQSSAIVRDPDAACDIRDRMLQALSHTHVDGFVFHPYPVNPFHGDYLQHYDLAQTARQHYLGVVARSTSKIKVKAEGALATKLVSSQWQPTLSEWDAAVEEISVAGLMASQRYHVNGWFGPPWPKQGWFHAYLLLGDALRDPQARQRADTAIQRLRTGDYRQPEEKLNLERELLALLISNCQTTVFGYTAKRQYFNSDFSAGIENIAYDSHTGLNSAIFVRTVKLKDFPWNGWLRLGIDATPAAAWNPIAGFTDEAGRLVWWALGDPALFPTPYADGWELNRIIDVQQNR